MHTRLLASLVMALSCFAAVAEPEAISAFSLQSPPQSKPTLSLHPQYEIGRPTNEDSRGARVMLIDTLRLLNKSMWRPDSEPLPISADEAIGRAFAAFSASAPDLRKNHLFRFSLRYFFGDAAENVWYYEIAFDGGRRLPINERRGKPADLKRAIVLMDGSVWLPKFETYEEIKKRHSYFCSYSKLDDQWTAGECQDLSAETAKKQGTNHGFLRGSEALN